MIDQILYGGIYLFIGIAIVFGLFLLAREVTLWYFRVNEIVALLEKQNKLLEIIAAERTRNVSKPVISRTDVQSGQPQSRANPLAGSPGHHPTE